MTGIRADIEVRAPAGCPVAEVSDSTTATVGDVAWATAAGDAVTEEVTVAGEADVGDDRLRPTVGYDDGQVYRFERPADHPCACVAVEELGVPVADVQAADGSLLLTLHLDDREELRTVVAELREYAESVSLRCLARTGDDGDGGDLVAFDRSQLTDRQREVLRTAQAMGYFEYPRKANATDVAEALGIGLSTFTEHLAAAESKLVGGVVEA